FKNSGIQACVGCVLFGSALLLSPLLSPPANSADRAPLKASVRIDRSRGPVAAFFPDEVFGAALDGQKQCQLARIYTPANTTKMLRAGLRKITYRLRTELSIEAWHWSEQGSWSDEAHQQGYWISSASPDQRILISHGYRLPRRGNTFDQGRND